MLHALANTCRAITLWYGPMLRMRCSQAPIIGLGVIILDSLLRREWVKEDELAADLKVHPRILRKALRWFEQVSEHAAMPLRDFTLLVVPLTSPLPQRLMTALRLTLFMALRMIGVRLMPCAEAG